MGRGPEGVLVDTWVLLEEAIELVRGREALGEWLDLGGEETGLVGLVDKEGALGGTESFSKMPLRLVRVEDLRVRLRIDARSSVVVVGSRDWEREEARASRRGKGVKLRIWRAVMCLMRLWFHERTCRGQRRAAYGGQVVGVRERHLVKSN